VAEERLAKEWRTNKMGRTKRKAHWGRNQPRKYSNRKREAKRRLEEEKKVLQLWGLWAHSLQLC